ncbi:CDP-alcohol phosphatidyltransferase family protein [Naasia aerilata]|uniref:CDP-alcohol phosphatidyltransferase family protein n=1 Tax=Naasia aerilata TaxID=1162966 RepID=UPI0025722075|nr:CDP-alcohol phosphatidyltransferase family protein [Naasia aerilata]
MTDLADDTSRLTVPVALERLRSSQKSSKGAAAYSRFVNRPLGRVLAAVAATAGLRPNQVTAISAVFTFAGIVLLATVPPSLGLGVGVTLLLLVGYALDSADGQVARLRGGGSLAGSGSTTSSTRSRPPPSTSRCCCRGSASPTSTLHGCSCRSATSSSTTAGSSASS